MLTYLFVVSDELLFVFYMKLWSLGNLRKLVKNHAKQFRDPLCNFDLSLIFSVQLV